MASGTLTMRVCYMKKSMTITAFHVQLGQNGLIKVTCIRFRGRSVAPKDSVCNKVGELQHSTVLR